MNPIKVTILGASGPYPGSDDLPSVLVSFGRFNILLDAGEGVQHRLQHVGSSVASINCVLITHMHGDHVLGLIPLIQSRSLSGSLRPLIIVGPKGIKEYLISVFRYLFFKPRYDLVIKEVNGGEIVEPNDSVIVKVVKLIHLIPTVGYVIIFNKLRKISYITDTRPSSSYIELIKGSDLLIHDSTFSKDDEKLAREYGHSTAVDAGKLAVNSNSKLLLLFHVSPRYRKSSSRLLNEARKYFSNAWIARQYMRVLIK